jgi:CHAD domain-containing protein
MSEQRMIEMLGDDRLLLGELLRDARVDSPNPIVEIEQMMAAVRQQLSELTLLLRSDLEGLRRLVSEQPPARATSGSARDSHAARAAAPVPARPAPRALSLDRLEAPTAGIRRIVCGQIDAAIDDLQTGTLRDPGAAVHSCRKRFKRVRAAARLVRDELNSDSYRQENAAFRDFGRRLSHARDSQVLVETLDALHGRYALEIPSAGFERLRAALADEHRAAEQRVREQATAETSMIDELSAARERVAAWRLRHDAMSALAPGFERIYGSGRRAFRAARTDPTDESFHELRKRTKDLWHAAQILRGTAPEKMRDLADRTHRLSDLVGEEHDLAVLSQHAEQRPECLTDEREAALLHTLITRRRHQVQREALELAQSIFASKPRSFAVAFWQAPAAS